MTPRPRVSVVMPLHDKEAFVGAAIASVRAQSVASFELIVVDDGSTDASAAIVERVRDPRVRLVRRERAGVASARNLGVAQAAAGLVAFLDADDLWDPDFLETVLGLAERFPGCAAYATGYRYVLPGGGERPAMVRGVPPAPWEGLLDDYFDVAARSDPPLWTSAVAVARPALERVGGFPPSLTLSEDVVTWARLAAGGPIAYAASPRASYRLRGSLYDLTRDPDVDAEAGAMLEALLSDLDARRRRSLERFVASWYRNRASRYLRLGRTASARREVDKMRSFQEPDLRYYLFALTARLPGPVAARVARRFTLVNRFRRAAPGRPRAPRAASPGGRGAP
jgi:glycosyltransferase involved in cell wall biosynthesis